MRPLELRLRGFRSYREEAAFDWRERGLVGVVGPIGAGKSSILDAMAFALYGKTPSVEGATKSLIHQLCTESHVELRFEVDGQVWRAVRSLRRKGASGHRLERLAADEPSAEVVEAVDGDEPTKARVEELLGMDFKAFCRSVLLAQNRFSDFLKATPGQRDEVLKGVFGYERLDAAQKVARLRLQQVELELDALRKERSSIDEARAQLEDARAAAAEAQRRLRTLEAAAPEVERIAKEREAADADARDARTRTAALHDVAAALPSQEDVEGAADRGARAAEVVRLATAKAEAAQAARDLAHAALADVVSRLGDREQFRSFEALLATFDRQAAEARRAEEAVAGARQAVEAALARVDRLGLDATSAAAALTEADTDRASAAAAVARARASLMEARHADMARELRGTLEAGAACPVCDQPVHAVPRGRAAAPVATAERTLEKAEKAESNLEAEQQRRAAAEAAARAAVKAAGELVEGAHVAEAQAEALLREVEATVASTQSQLTDWLGEDGDARSAFRARESELTAAEETLETAKALAEAARATLSGAKDAAAEAVAALGKIGTRLAGAWGKLGEDRDMPADPASIRAAFLEVGEAVIARHEAAAAQGEDAAERTASATEALGELLREAGREAGANFAGAMTSAGIAHGTAAQVVLGLEERIERAGSLEGELLEAEARRDLTWRLAEDLKPSRFLAFLLEEERAQLADLGSEHFEQLTDGSYRFTQDDRFDILDINAAGAVRKADSLSGGETFLASLALALGLAEMVARSGGRLDAFFLDEGFGSLDPEHLDRAMDGIGRLVAEDARRLVVVVSHVTEMREAVEDLIVLDKDPLTGDTVVVSGARPA